MFWEGLLEGGVGLGQQQGPGLVASTLPHAIKLMPAQDISINRCPHNNLMQY